MKTYWIGFVVSAFLITLFVASFAAAESMRYEPDKKSVRKHQTPGWYHDAKFGIFIHWSLFSVPGYAPVSDRTIWEIAEEEGVEGQLKHNPYAEWYLNTMKIEGSPTRQYHLEKYGEDFSYFDFAPIFNEKMEKWDPNKWAGIFREAGARYVVMVTKHHDGFLLWPSERRNPFYKDYCADRDAVGELTKAVRAEDMRMGFYYSGGLDWTFRTVPITDAASYLTNGPVSREYTEYVASHFKELIDRYAPSILWNDICYPPDGDPFELFAYYYNCLGEGAVNDRWSKFPKHGRKTMMSWPLRPIINWVGNRMAGGAPPSPEPPHADFTTPEYAQITEIKRKKWESTRGVGHSFGYNRMETEKHHMDAPKAIRYLVDVVSKNGNLLLNVGPRADGSIPEEQLECLKGIGEWLKINGEAIYGTRPWKRAEGETTDGTGVRFTQKRGNLYAVLMRKPLDSTVEIIGLETKAGTEIKLLGCDKPLKWSQAGENLRVTLPASMPESPAYVFVFSELPR